MGYSLWGCKESDMTEQLTQQQRNTPLYCKSSILIMSINSVPKNDAVSEISGAWLAQHSDKSRQAGAAFV